MIIAGFPCVGKTTMGNKYENVIDLSSTKYHYIVEQDKINEQLKGNEKQHKVNPNWPQNYIDEVVRIKDKYDVVFVCDRVEILSLMISQNIDFLIAMPHKNLKYDYIERAKQRGNNEKFLKIYEEKFNIWWNDMNSLPVKKIYLEKDEYVEDALIRLNLFNSQTLLKNIYIK